MGGRGLGGAWTALLPGFLVAGVGAGMVNPVLANLALSMAPDEASGVAAGVNDTFRQVGVATGVAALGALLLARASDHIQDVLALGADQAHRLAEAAWSGPRRGVPAPLADAAQAGFVEGRSDVLLVGAGLAIAEGSVTIALVRSSDVIGHGLLDPGPEGA